MSHALTGSQLQVFILLLAPLLLAPMLFPISMLLQVFSCCWPLLLLVSMLLPLSMLLLVPMLLQVFLLFFGPSVTGAHALSHVHAVANTHANAGVSAVVGPTNAGVLNCIMMSLLLLVLHLPMPEKSSIP
jgi:hypothetical protein